jgi:hypothetical protein
LKNVQGEFEGHQVSTNWMSKTLHLNQQPTNCPLVISRMWRWGLCSEGVYELRNLHHLILEQVAYVKWDCISFVVINWRCDWTCNDIKVHPFKLEVILWFGMVIFIGHLKGGFRTSISILVYYDSYAFSSFNSNFLPLFQFLIILPSLELPPISSSAGLVPGNGSWWLILPGLQSVTRGPFPGVNSEGNMFKLRSQFYSFEWQSSLWRPRHLENCIAGMAPPEPPANDIT